MGEGRYKATNAPRGSAADRLRRRPRLHAGRAAAGRAGRVQRDRRRPDHRQARRARRRSTCSAEGDKIRDDQGNRLVDLRLTFDVRFPEGEDGDRAREVLPRSIAQSRDRLCTVGRTVQVGAPIEYVEA